MSGTKRLPVVLSEPAFDDLELIFRYGEKHWGQDQAYSYRSLLLSCTERIGMFPEIGQGVQERDDPMRFVIAESHFMYYKVLNGTIVILRITNRRLDPRELFQ